MSNGFPNRPGRGTFGPALQNAKPVRNPALNPDADIFNLLFYQTAGCGLMVPRAWALVDGTGGAGPARIVAHAESWNVDGKTSAPYNPPVLGYTSPGICTLTYQATYPDDSGNSVAVSPLAAQGKAIGSINVRNVAVTNAGPVLTIKLTEFGGGVFAVIDGQALVWFM